MSLYQQNLIRLKTSSDPLGDHWGEYTLVDNPELSGYFFTPKKHGTHIQNALTGEMCYDEFGTPIRVGDIRENLLWSKTFTGSDRYVRMKSLHLILKSLSVAEKQETALLLKKLHPSLKDTKKLVNFSEDDLMALPLSVLNTLIAYTNKRNPIAFYYQPISSQVPEKFKERYDSTRKTLFRKNEEKSRNMMTIIH